MRRLFLIAFLTAGLGSLMATVICALIPGIFGPGSGFDSLAAMFRFSMITMVFTVPGAGLLVELQRELQARELPGWAIAPSIMVAGGVAGALIFLALNFEPLWAAALYGTSTAIALLIVGRLPGLSPSAAR